MWKAAEQENFTFTSDDEEPCGWFAGRSRQAALDEVLEGLRARAGYICLTGSPGVGKSVLATSLAQAHVAQGGRAIFADGSALSLGWLVRELLRVTGVTLADEPPRKLEALLPPLYAAGDLGMEVALVVDSAHLLEDRILQALAYLANPWQPGRSAVQLVLVGRPELLDRLNSPELAPLGRLCARRIVLRPMEPRESEAYLRWKYALAPDGTGEAFTAPARRRLAGLSGGVPRLLDMLAEAALATGQAYGRFPVTRGLVRLAMGNIPGHAPLRLPVGKTLAMAAAILLLVSAGAWWSRQALVAGLEQVAGGLLGQASASVERLEAPWMTAQPTPGWAESEVAVGRALAGIVIVKPEASPGTGQADGLAGGGDLLLVVAPGDSLLGLCRKIYGRADTTTMRAVLTANPAIADPNIIEVGQVIHFPPELPVLPAETGLPDA